MFLNPYRLGVVLVAGIVLLASYTAPGQKLEGLLLHLGGRLMPEQAQDSSVVVVAIDDATLKVQGDWPWPRDRLAAVIDRLAEFKPATLGVMLPLTDAETVGDIALRHQDIAALDPALQASARQWLAQLDTDATLAQSLAAATDTVLSADYFVGTDSAGGTQALDAFVLDSVSSARPWHLLVPRALLSSRMLTDYGVAPPLPLFVSQVSGIGLSPAYRSGQWVHGGALAVESGGRYLPAFELLLWAAHRQHALADFLVTPGVALHTAAGEPIGTADLGWYPQPAVAPPVYSLHEMMQADAPAGHLAGKSVLLGITASGLVPMLKGPAGNDYSPVAWSAQLLASLHAGNGFAMPAWFYAAQRLLVVVFALYLLLIPVTWHGLRGLLAALAIAAVAVNAGLVTLIVKNLWLPVMLPTLFLLAVTLVLALSSSRRKGMAVMHQALLDTRVALAAHLQSQGQLDQAMEQYLLCLPAPAVLQPLYELGLDYERHRQVGKAQLIYEKLLGCSKSFRDVKQRCRRLAQLSDRFPSAAASSAGKTMVLDGPVMERPVLGRYQVERELGQGAMGTVYLAVDPRISREVAIKTLPLLQEFEGAEQAAVAERFFQEAEAVGRLDHPNIVTVYDAGKEHDLAYIAMDYVPGTSLDRFTGKPDLLPVWEVLEIALQVAEALDYAHQCNVVHRDIKPGNIMYVRETGVAKLTDFGVARLLDTSRTRTGTILGSPSYMSPEQVAGKKTDGRSDLFSLGVTLFQLLSGELPFSGDSVAALMYQIANKKTPAIRKLRSGLPVSVSRLINKAMQKNPANRYENGKAMAEALRKCRAQFRGGRRKSA